MFFVTLGLTRQRFPGIHKGKHDRTDKCDFIKIRKKICSSKDIVRKMKRQITDWEKSIYKTFIC